MGTFKDFTYQIRKLELEVPLILLINEYPALHFKECVKMIQNVPYESNSRHVYYGDIRSIMNGFVNFCMVCMAHACKKVEHYTHRITHDEFDNFYKNTIIRQDRYQEDFKNDFQPIVTEEDQRKLNEIESKYKIFRTEIMKFGAYLATVTKKPVKVQEYAKSILPQSIEQISKMIDFSNLYVARMLAERLSKIRVSIEETSKRLNLNVTEFDQHYMKCLNKLYDELYDLNREKLYISRGTRASVRETDNALIDVQISNLREKIQAFGNYRTFQRLSSEKEYWSKRLKDFDEIANVITKLKAILDGMAATEKLYQKYKPGESPSHKPKCWDIMRKKFPGLKDDLEKKYLHACRTLITFFCCRGTDRILYTDHIGSYFIDEYGHHNYITSYGTKFYHINCMGEFIENIEKEKYYFDEAGRYIFEDDKKIYQIAPCTSKYELEPNGLMNKIGPCYSCSKDPCIFQLANKEEEILPKTKVIDIESTLDTETVEYLWDTFGWILPQVLNEVAETRPKNPIHYFGHVLLNMKYFTTPKEMMKKKIEANKYRDGVIRQRIEDAKAKTRAWRSKMAKPCKPEDFDTTPQDLAYIAYQSHNQYLVDVCKFYDDNAYMPHSGNNEDDYN